MVHRYVLSGQLIFFDTLFVGLESVGQRGYIC